MYCETVQKNVLTAMIIRIYFVIYIFMVYVNHKIIFTMKIFRSMVVIDSQLSIQKPMMKPKESAKCSTHGWDLGLQNLGQYHLPLLQKCTQSSNKK